jgi:hypothetical protein
VIASSLTKGTTTNSGQPRLGTGALGERLRQVNSAPARMLQRNRKGRSISATARHTESALSSFQKRKFVIPNLFRDNKWRFVILKQVQDDD